jgi:hypothetical protein
MKVAFAIMFLCTVSGFGQTEPTEPGPSDGIAFLRNCQDALSQQQKGSARSGWCLGYVSGFFSGIALPITRDSVNLACYPKDRTLSGELLLQIAVKYMQTNASSLKSDYRLLLAGAFASAFPCSEP